MRKISVNREIQVPRAAVWDVLGDFPNIAACDRGVTKSYATGDVADSVG